MGRKKVLLFACALVLGAGTLGVVWFGATRNAPADSDTPHSTSVVETLRIPESSVPEHPGEEKPFLDAVKVREAISETVLKYAYLPFPSEAAESSHVDRLASIPFEESGQWEDGIQDMVVLQSWRCEWLEHAVTSFEEENLEEVKRSGMLIEQLSSFPAIQESSPDYESYLQQWIRPLIDGNGASAQTALEAECRDW